MKKIIFLLLALAAIFVTPVRAEIGSGNFCNFSPGGTASGDVTISNSCVIYEDINGTANGNLYINNANIVINREMVWPPGHSINIGNNASLIINSNASVVKKDLCVLDQNSNGYPGAKTIAKDPNTGADVTTVLTQIDTVEANGDGSCPSGYRLRSLMNSLAYFDPSDSAGGDYKTTDAEFLRLGFTINGVTDANAAAGDIIVPGGKNLIVTDKLGIGTTNPGQKLDVNGTIVANGSRPITISPAGTISVKGDSGGWANSVDFIGSSNTNRGGFGALGSADALTYLYAGDSYSSPTMVWKSGNVGIGTTNPSRQLTVTNSSSANDVIWGYAAGSSYTGTVARFDSETSGSGLNLISSRYGTGLASTAFLVRGDGNVGIGTTTPGQKLDVIGAIKSSQPLGQNLPRFIWYDDGYNASYLSYDTDAVTRFKSTSSWIWQSVPVQSGIYTNGTTRMTLDNSGNLAVTGTLTVGGVAVRAPNSQQVISLGQSTLSTVHGGLTAGLQNNGDSDPNSHFEQCQGGKYYCNYFNEPGMHVYMNLSKQLVGATSASFCTYSVRSGGYGGVILRRVGVGDYFNSGDNWATTGWQCSGNILAALQGSPNSEGDWTWFWRPTYWGYIEVNAAEILINY